MSPIEAMEKQIDAYRRMSGDERLRIALELSDLSCKIAREGIRHQFPAASDDQVWLELRRRVELGR